MQAHKAELREAVKNTKKGICFMKLYHNFKFRQSIAQKDSIQVILKTFLIDTDIVSLSHRRRGRVGRHHYDTQAQ